MVTLLYAILGLLGLVLVWLIPMLDVWMLDDWARVAYLEARFAGRATVGAPPLPWRRRVYVLALVATIALFLGALALPR